jgi:hypothetical protein
MTETTEQNGTARLPMWAQVVSIVGVPAAVLGYVLWAQNPKLDRIEASTVKFSQDLEVQKDQSWALYGVLQRICLNTAKSDEDKKACTTIVPRPR